jgi:hypothetical protein
MTKGSCRTGLGRGPQKACVWGHLTVRIMLSPGQILVIAVERSSVRRWRSWPELVWGRDVEELAVGLVGSEQRFHSSP